MQLYNKAENVVLNNEKIDNACLLKEGLCTVLMMSVVCPFCALEKGCQLTEVSQSEI